MFGQTTNFFTLFGQQSEGFTKLAQSSFPSSTMSSEQNQEEMESKNHSLMCNSYSSGNVCGYKASDDRDLDDHQIKVHGKRSIPLSKKYWRPFQKEQMEEYVSAEAKTDRRKFKKTSKTLPCPYKEETGCPYAGHKFHLKTHMKVHLPEEEKKDQACDQCDRKFADPSNLRRHQKQKHEKLLNWRCDKCIKPLP